MRVHRGLLLGALLSLAMGLSAQAGLIVGHFRWRALVLQRTIPISAIAP